MVKLADLEAIAAENDTPKTRLADLEAIVQEDIRKSGHITPANLKGMTLNIAGFDTGVEMPESLTAGLIQAGRGFADLARGTGFLPKETEQEKQMFASLEQDFPVASTVGRVSGQTAPFLLPSTGIGAVASLLPRVAASVGLGAVEGGILTNAQSTKLEDVVKNAGAGGLVAGGLEVAFPIVGRLAGSLFRQVTGKLPEGALLTAEGLPTPELQDALDKANLSFEDLTRSAIEQVKKAAGANPDEVARMAQFESLNVPASRGDITQNLADQATESRLLENTVDPASEQFRQLKLAQSEAFRQNFQQIVDNLGVPQDTGENLIAALEGRKKLLRDEKNRLYREFAETAPEAQQVPLVTDTIAEAIPSPKTARRIERLASTAKGAFDDLMTEFGLNKDPNAINKFIQSGGEIETLTVGNFDDFRQALNIIERTDQTGAIKVLTGPVKNALDEEADLVETALQKAGITDEKILAPLEQARATVTELKTEFDPKKLTGKLASLKPKSTARQVEASQVVDTILKKGTPVEQVTQVVDNLKKGGESGLQALGDLQASTVLDLLDSAFKASGRKIDGQRVISPAALQKRLEQIGTDKIDIIFDNAKEAKNVLFKNIQAAANAQPASAAIPKGSASLILDLAKSTGITPILNKSPTARGVLETIRVFAERGQNADALEKALNTMPDVKQTATFIERELPGLAAAAGIAGFIVPPEQDEGE